MITEILKIFPETIFKYKLDGFENFNKELKKYIYELQKNDEQGLERSNRGGWHSKEFELKEVNSIQYKFALNLQKYILNTFQNLGWKIDKKNIRIAQMWAIINKHNDFNVIHTHPNSFLSAAYYVQAPKNCGKFKVENPNIAKRYYYPEIEKYNEFNAITTGIEIEQGDLLIFPSYLPHRVSENKTSEDRIVISFNVDIK